MVCTIDIVKFSCGNYAKTKGDENAELYVECDKHMEQEEFMRWMFP